MSAWFIKHKPRKFTELLFSDDNGFKILSWLENAKRGSVLNIYGSVGKCCILHSAAKALRYNILEYETLKDLKTLNGRNLDGESNLLLVYESDMVSGTTPQKILNQNITIPVVFITSNTIIINPQTKVEFIKIQALRYDVILHVVKKILKAESKTLSNTLILHLCDLCNGDIRSIINYCQLYSQCNIQATDLRMIEKVTVPTITSICRSLLSKRMRLKQLENLYSEKAVNMCLRSVLENSKDQNVLKTIESISELSLYPEQFRFLSLDHLNKVTSEFIYKKEEEICIKNTHGHENPLQFLPLYDRKLQNRESVLHLQEIFRTYNIKDLSDIDREIYEYIDTKPIDIRVFKYKYNFGSSSSVKRDISFKEFLDI